MLVTLSGLRCATARIYGRERCPPRWPFRPGPRRRLAAERALDPPHRVEVPVSRAVAEAPARQVEAVVEERRELEARDDVAVVAHVLLDRAERGSRLAVAASRAVIDAPDLREPPLRVNEGAQLEVDGRRRRDERLALVEDRRRDPPCVHARREGVPLRDGDDGARGDEGSGGRVVPDAAGAELVAPDDRAGQVGSGQLRDVSLEERRRPRSPGGHRRRWRGRRRDRLEEAGPEGELALERPLVDLDRVLAS